MSYDFPNPEWSDTRPYDNSEFWRHSEPRGAVGGTPTHIGNCGARGVGSQELVDRLTIRRTDRCGCPAELNGLHRASAHKSIGGRA